MVYAVINFADIKPWIVPVIILGFAIFGAVKGIYGLVSPIVAAIISLVAGIAFTSKVDPVAGSRFLTFLIISAVVWGIITVLRKLGDKVSNWFIIGWINHLTGFFAGALIGYMIQAFIFNIINMFGGRV